MGVFNSISHVAEYLPSYAPLMVVVVTVAADWSTKCINFYRKLPGFEIRVDEKIWKIYAGCANFCSVFVKSCGPFALPGSARTYLHEPKTYLYEPELLSCGQSCYMYELSC